jgi:hypothetical protein
MFYYKNYTDRFIHKDLDIPENYKSVSLHIALERADMKKDWQVFKKLLHLDFKTLIFHLENTKSVFDYNFFLLSDVEKQNILNI